MHDSMRGVVAQPARPASSTVGNPALVAALDYIESGWRPIPIPHRTKAPATAAWSNLRLTAATAPAYFNRMPSNIGILLGEPSDWLIDIDIDAVGDGVSEQVDRFLPATQSIFGRASKPRSHRLYYVTAPIATAKFKDPLLSKNNMLVELRATGTQTVFPPSTHGSREPIEWDVDGVPESIAPEVLHEHVVRFATALLVQRYARDRAGELLASPEQWPAALDAVDRRLGDAARKWSRQPVTNVHSGLADIPDYLRTPEAQRLDAWLGDGAVPYSIEEAGRLIGALACLKEAARDYDTWWQYGLAIYRLGWGQNGFKIWDRWSQLCPEKYDAAACVRKWASFAEATMPADAKRVASIYHAALAKGWIPSTPTVNATDDESSPPPPAIGKVIGGRLILHPKAPMDSMREFVECQYKIGSLRTIHCHNGIPYVWTGTHYSEVSEPTLRGQLYIFLEKARYVDDKGKLVPFNPTRSKVSDVLDALASVVALPEGIKAPAWISGAIGAPATEICSCTNGLLHLPTRALLPHTPNFFTLNALDFAFDAGAPAPVEWLKFLGSLWGDDAETISTLQEILGYCLTADMRQQKVFLIIGPKRSGKGTIARILTRLVGAENVAGPTLASLAQNFGLAPLIGKRVAIISDARLGSRADQQAIVERLLAISGEDALTIDRKHRAAWTGRLQTRFVALSNELPRLADASGALASRFIVLVITRSFYGSEDHGLETRLAAELPGILSWSIDGWKRLQQRGYFISPTASMEAVRDLEDLGSPIGAFVRERCVLDAVFEVDVGQLFLAYQIWCKGQGRDHAGTVQTFARDLRAAIPGLKIVKHREEDGRKRYYQGLRLRDAVPGGPRSSALPL